MRIPSAMILVLLSVSVLYAATPDWFAGSFDEAKSLAAVQNKLLLVDFVSTT